MKMCFLHLVFSKPDGHLKSEKDMGCEPYKEQFIVEGEPARLRPTQDAWIIDTPDQCIEECRRSKNCLQWEWRENNAWSTSESCRLYKSVNNVVQGDVGNSAVGTPHSCKAPHSGLVGGEKGKHCDPSPMNCKAPDDLVCGKDGCTYQNTCEAGGQDNVQCFGSCPCKTDKSGCEPYKEQFIVEGENNWDAFFFT